MSLVFLSARFERSLFCKMKGTASGTSVRRVGKMAVEGGRDSMSLVILPAGFVKEHDPKFSLPEVKTNIIQYLHSNWPYSGHCPSDLSDSGIGVMGKGVKRAVR